MENTHCMKCSKIISKYEKYAITMFFVEDMPSAPYYAHLKCPEKFTILE